MESFGATFRSIWHAMTSNDRHSTFDSPIRTGRHVPLQNGRGSTFTGVATASDSRADITSPYSDETGRASPVADTPGSPAAPYSPGLRGVAARNASQSDGFEVQSPGDVPMQSFQDGLPPPPPVSHSWKRIDSWADENYPELFDQLCEGATHNDLNELEHQLDCSLPQDVRESLMIHDGQERGGMPTGIIFSGMLMDCEEMVQEWDQWRQVNQQYMLENAAAAKNARASPSPAGGSNEASSSRQPPSQDRKPGAWRQDLIQRQDCVPPDSVQKAYAHPQWIPLVRDWGGNNLAVDLAPGPRGQWGQIVMFGRDYDTKYVVARSWAAFLAVVADDLNSGKWYVDEDTSELKLREFKETRVEPPYFSILRWRMDQKYGRRAARRKSMAPSKSKSNSPLGSRSSSPYASSMENGEGRGRSMQRPTGSSPLASPMRHGYGKATPLSRVTEEMASSELADAVIQPEKLVEVESPRQSTEGKAPTVTTTPLKRVESDLLKQSDMETPKANGKQPEIADESMKTIEI